MNRTAWAVFVVALAFNAALALFIARPGYMDAYYYFDGAQRLARGHGFTETYLWNYLGDPARLPHPSHLYWMPLTSIVAALPMWLCGGLCPDNAALFRAAQIPAVLLASALPVLAYLLAARARQAAEGSEPSAPGRVRWLALASAWFALFGGFYSLYWANTDSFALYGVLGSLALICTGRAAARGSAAWFAVAGLLAGLAHLTRADGFLLAGIAGLCAVWPWPGWRPALQRGGAVVGGYFLVMLPWFARNQIVVGTPLAPGGSQALWFTAYNDLFNFPARSTLATYLAAGWGAILAGKWQAVTLNLQTLIAVQGWIVLTPFIAVGLWRLRRAAHFRPAIAYALLLWLVMTFAFTFPGPRGGLLHSSVALLPFFAAAGPLGVERAVLWVARRLPHWEPPKAIPVFLVMLGAAAAALTLGLFYARVLGPDLARPIWNGRDEVYREIAAWFDQTGEGQSVVLVNNPPGYYYFSGQPAIIVPNGGIDTLLAAAARYSAPWVILDENVPDGLISLYQQEAASPQLRLRAQFADQTGQPVYLYEVALP